MKHSGKLYIAKQASFLKNPAILARIALKNKGLLGGAALGSAATGTLVPGENFIKDLLFDKRNGMYDSGFKTIADFLNRAIPNK